MDGIGVASFPRVAGVGGCQDETHVFFFSIKGGKKTHTPTSIQCGGVDVWRPKDIPSLFFRFGDASSQPPPRLDGKKKTNQKRGLRDTCSPPHMLLPRARGSLRIVRARACLVYVPLPACACTCSLPDLSPPHPARSSSVATNEWDMPKGEAGASQTFCGGGAAAEDQPG